MPIDQSEVERELIRLQVEWPALILEAGPAPYFSWEDWKEILLNLTHDPEHEMLVRVALSAVLRQSLAKPAYLTHEDLVAVAIAAHGNTWDFASPPVGEDET